MFHFNWHGASSQTPTTIATVEGSISLPPTPASIAEDYAEIADEPCSKESSNSHMTTDVKSSEKYEPKADDNRPDITGSSHYYNNCALTQVDKTNRYLYVTRASP